MDPAHPTMLAPVGGSFALLPLLLLMLLLLLLTAIILCCHGVHDFGVSRWRCKQYDTGCSWALSLS